MPDERSVITQSEFQSLQAAYGVCSATASQQPAPPQNTTTLAPLLKQEAQRGYVLALTDGQTHVQFGELAHLIADALWPDAGADDARMTYGCTRVNLDAELVRAVKSGTLQVKDPLTFGPHTFPVGNALLSALVTVDDMREFVAGRGLTVETAKTQAATPSPAPVVTDVSAFDGPDRKPDPERRLDLLRALGGTSKYARGQWKFTGIGALVESEKAKGQKRSDEKTIRADLKDAAQTERDAKSAGFGSGLGKL